MIETNIEDESQGDGSKKPKGSELIKQKVDKLLPLQQDRFFAIYGRYGANSFDVLEFYKAKRGEGQFKVFLERSEAANDPENAEFTYMEALADALELHEEYSKLDIVEIVHKQREHLGMTTYTESVFMSCLNDLSKVFLIEITDDKMYVPVFLLMVR